MEGESPPSHCQNNHHHKEKNGAKRLLFMLFFTFSYFLVEIIVGYLTKSMALVADSFHMLSDVVALVVAFVSVILSQRKWSRSTYGLQRAEILGALINAVFLFALCFSIVVESLQRFFEPQKLIKPELVLYVGGFGLLVNLIGLGIFGGHGHSHGGSETKEKSSDAPKNGQLQAQNMTNNIIACKNNKSKVEWEVNSEPITLSVHSLPDLAETHSQNTGDGSTSTPKKPKNTASHSHQMNIHGVFLHILADALGSVVVIISALIVWLTDWEYKDYVDPALSVCLVILICVSTWPLFIESSMILLQTLPRDICVQDLEHKIINQVGSVRTVHDLHIWQLTGRNIVGNAHVICNDGEDSAAVLHEITEIFRNEGVNSITIQLEIHTGEESTDSSQCLLNSIQNQNLHEHDRCTSNGHHHHHSDGGIDNKTFMESV